MAVARPATMYDLEKMALTKRQTGRSGFVSRDCVQQQEWRTQYADCRRQKVNLKLN